MMIHGWAQAFAKVSRPRESDTLEAVQKMKS